MYTQGYNDALGQLGLVNTKTAGASAAGLKDALRGAKNKIVETAGKASTSAKSKYLTMKDHAADLSYGAKEKAKATKAWAQENPYKAIGATAGGTAVIGGGAGYAAGRPSKKTKEEEKNAGLRQALTATKNFASRAGAETGMAANKVKNKMVDLGRSAQFKGMEANQALKDQMVMNPGRTLGIAAAGTGLAAGGAGYAMGRPGSNPEEEQVPAPQQYQ